MGCVKYLSMCFTWVGFLSSKCIKSIGWALGDGKCLLPKVKGHGFESKNQPLQKNIYILGARLPTNHLSQAP
jgi:hypothetical protein